jgi:hypothetical protein
VSSFKLRQDTLDEFVALVDAKGGPHLLGVSPEWHHISYVPTLKVDQSLDPYSDAYCDQQIALYKEISGRELDQYSNEQTEFDMVRHVNQRNAFGGMPSDLALHYARLSKLIVKASRKSQGLGHGLRLGDVERIFRLARVPSDSR